KEIAAQLAEQYYNIGNKKEAGKLADQVLEADPRHPIAAYVKAHLLVDAKQADIAVTLLEEIAKTDTAELKPLRLLGRIQFDSQKYGQASRTFERCRKLDPNDNYFLEQLAKA